MNSELYESLNPDIFLFVERRDTPDWKLDERQSGFHELYFIMNGKSVFYVNGQSHSAQAGDIVYIPGGSFRTAHTIREAPMHAYALNFFWIHDNHITLPFDVVTRNRINDDILSCLTAFAHSWTNGPSRYKLNERGMFLQLLHHLFMTYNRNTLTYRDPRIKKVVEYMTDHYSENLDLEGMARLTNLHPVYLGRLFKLNTGFTFKETLNRIRVGNAERMLAASGFSMAEVAEQCGFRDMFYFSKVFKNTKGYPPSSISRKR